MGINSGSKINIRIPKKIIINKELSKRFLRGLFDTDGNIYFDKNRSAKNPRNDRPVIKIGTVSKNLVYKALYIFKKLGFNPRMKKLYKGKRDKNPVYTLLIYRIADIKLFMDVIGFKNGKHYTKWLIYNKFGYCPPKTTLQQRKSFLENTKLFNEYK